jgi:type IV pilus assembly protein PilE
MIKKTSAFTLIEILVVATIIIVLTTISIASFSTANKSARDAKRKSDMETIRQALVLYKTQTGAYPTPASDFAAVTSPLVPATGTQYLTPPVPSDPGSASYTGSSNASSFCVCAVSETSKGNRSAATCPSTGWTTTGGAYYCAKNP